MDTIISDEKLCSPETVFIKKLEAYLYSILNTSNTEAQAASIPELGRLLMELYQSGNALEPVLPPLPQPRTQAVIFKQKGNVHKNHCDQRIDT